MRDDKSRKKKTVYIVIGIIVAWIFLFSIANWIDKGNDGGTGDKIAVIPIIGEISSSGSSGFPISSDGASSTSLVNSLERAEKDENVKAIILEINSPGGTVVASEEVADKVGSIEKPVVAWIRDIGTSGAYWIASSSDTIVADPLSITGSIGVIGSYLEFSKLMKKYGVGYEGLTTGKYKDIGSPFKELTPDEKDLLLSKMYIIHDVFVDQIAENRNMPRDKVANLATGMFYIGKEAKDLGLVDRLGGKQVAIDTAKNLAGIEEAEITRYEERRSLIDILGQLSSSASYYVGRGIGFELSEKLNNPKLAISAT